MFQGRIVVDLPSAEIERPLTSGEWLRGFLGARVARGTGRERLSIDGLSLVDGLYQAFRQAGVDDAIAFQVDGQVLYLDTLDVEHDLEEVRKVATGSGQFDRPFQEVGLAMTRRQNGVHVMLDLCVRNEVPLGVPELEIDVCGRPDELTPLPGETAELYASRVVEIASNTRRLDRMREWTAGLAERLGIAVGAAIPGSGLVPSAFGTRLVVPDGGRIAAFTRLPFGDRVVAGRWRDVPLPREQAVDALERWWNDPYWSFTSLLLADALHGDETVEVVDVAGGKVDLGTRSPSERVHFSGDGIVVDPD